MIEHKDLNLVETVDALREEVARLRVVIGELTEDRDQLKALVLAQVDARQVMINNLGASQVEG